jgi:Family of unknown function (DUF6069)
VTHRTRRRLGIVLLAPVAALVAWAVIRLAGIELVVSIGDGTVGPADVVVAALVGALGGWFVVRLLERHTRSPERWWPAVGSMALAMSTIGPTWLAEDGSGVALTALHFVVGIVVITGFALTLPKCQHEACRCGKRLRGGDLAVSPRAPPTARARAAPNFAKSSGMARR